MGFEGDSLTGGMGGDYTSWGGPIKPNIGNSSQAQGEVEVCRAWFGE
jgi:hypothetical protein